MERVNPGLRDDVRKYGPFDTGGCFACGTCPIVCDLTGEAALFPRRIMRYAQIGLKQELLQSTEPWLCYDCGDCSDHCPQKAQPRESLLTVRRWLIAQYDWTGLASQFLRSRTKEIAALLIVGGLVFLLGWLLHRPEGIDWALAAFGHQAGLTHPCIPFLKAFDYGVLALGLALLFSMALRMYYFTIVRPGYRIPLRAYFTSLGAFFYHAGTQARFEECHKPPRRYGHALMAGATMLMIVLAFFFLDWFQTDKIHPIYHPQRWLGYIATVVLLYVPGEILYGRIFKKGVRGRIAVSQDWILPLLLLLTALTGILIHIFRYLGMDQASVYLYSAHMIVLIPMFLVELPFGKWSHMMYQPLALYIEALRHASESRAVRVVTATERL